MALFMKINGMKGNVTSQGYESWIELLSINNGVKRQISTRVGRTADREGTTPSFQEVEITKNIDASTPQLYQAACVDQAIPEVEIHACSTGKELSPYAKYKFSNVIISRYYETIHNEKYPVEMLKLNFTKVQKTYISRDSSNKSQSPTTFGFDLETAKKL